MGDLWCKTCGEFMFNDRHQCPPRWLVWQPDNGERIGDADKVYAHSPEDAAQLWAAQSDSLGDYDIVRGSAARVCVRSTSGGRVQVFEVTGESEPHYTAEQVKLGKEKSDG